MKTTTILFLGLALMSFSASAQNNSMFSGFGEQQQAPSQQQFGEHDLMSQDNHFLADIERIQKNITFMQLELKEKELEFKVMEQVKKMDELENPVVEDAESCETSEPSLFSSYVPAPIAPTFVEEDEEDEVIVVEPVAPLYVTSIKGVADNLKATISSEDIGTSVVSVGDVLNNGYKVVSISKNTMTLENANGDIETIGVTLRR